MTNNNSNNNLALNTDLVKVGHLSMPHELVSALELTFTQQAGLLGCVQQLCLVHWSARTVILLFLVRVSAVGCHQTRLGPLSWLAQSPTS